MMENSRTSDGDARSRASAFSSQKWCLFLVIYAIVATGCTTVKPTIPTGTYHESGTSNFVRVSNGQLYVHISGEDERDSGNTGLSFEYVLWPKGEVILLVSRSAELTYGYPSLDYRWDGKNIIVTNSRTGRRAVFATESSTATKPPGSEQHTAY